MKKLILSAVLALSIPITSSAQSEHDHDHGGDNALLAKSRVSMAAATALEVFEHSQAGSLWAFKTTKELDDAPTKVLYVDNNQSARAIEYDCHFHAHGSAEEAHCQDLADEAVAISAPAQLTFEVDAYLAALTSALDTVERKITPLTHLTSLKMWQAADLMYVTVTHDAGAGSVSSHFSCHIHGGTDIDCHRSKNVGPSEPSL